MCRTRTLPRDQVPCDRCAKVANPTDGWEHGWPLYGSMTLGFPAQAFYALSSRTVERTVEGPAPSGPPAFVVDGAQRVQIEWGPETAFRMCYSCQEELLAVVGEFFAYGLNDEREAKVAETRARIAREHADQLRAWGAS